jgi:CRISPR-associated protein Csb2
MPTILLRFPGGRYHATSWGHHVNEGQIEWPPCPWRLLRALIATGYSTQGWSEVPPAGRQLIEALANVLPTYQLPPASVGHSRHYMPIGKLDKGIEGTTLVFDTWANVGNDELAIRWDCQLDDEATALFESLVKSLGYLGRSESWVEARVAPSHFQFKEDRIAVPHEEGECRGPDWEQIPLMVPINPEAYADWHAKRTTAALAQFPLPEGRRKPTNTLFNKRAAAVAPFPEDMLDCLQKDTVWWKKQHNWSQPPGSQRALYWRRSDSLVVSTPRTIHRPVARPVEVILLALTTRSRNNSALPHVHRTLPQGELFHRAIVGRVAKGRRVDCPELTGRDELGKALRDGHRHAHVLPLDLDGDKRIDHVLVYASMGLGDAAQQAIRSLKRTWTKGGAGEIQVAVLGRGDLGVLRNLPELLADGVEQLLGPPRGSQTWISMTPFVPPRFVKQRGHNSIAGQIDAELESRGLPPSKYVEVLQDDSCALRHFVRVRHHGGPAPPRDIGYGIRIQLSEVVTGPIALGYGCHFGLGLFEAELPDMR